MNLHKSIPYISYCLGVFFVLLLSTTVRASELPNKLELIKLLKEGSHQRLEEMLVKYQSDYEKNPEREEAVELAYIAFETSDPTVEKQLNAWIKAMPNSFSARLARGAYFHRLGWLSRGARFIGQTDPAQISGMQDYFSKATKDILEAVAMNPRSSIAYGYLLSMGTADGARAMNEKILAEALKNNPHSFTVRRRYMHSLTPKWGGSFDKMQKFADESKDLSNMNPNIKFLPAYVLYARADTLRIDGDREGAAQKYTEAISFGDIAIFLEARGENYYRMGRYDRALVDLNKALALRPQYRAALFARGDTYYAMKNYDQAALNDFNLAIELDPLEPRLLVRRANTYWRLKKYDEAEKDFENALIFGKYSAYTWRSKAQFYYDIRKNYRQAAADYSRAVELEPEHSRSWFRLGSAYYYLKDKRAVETLDRYLKVCKITADCKDKDLTWAQGFVKCMRGTGPCEGKHQGQHSLLPGDFHPARSG